MESVSNELDRLQERLGELLAELALRSAPDAEYDDERTQLIAAFGQLFEVMTRQEAERTRSIDPGMPETALAAGELGEYAFNLLDQAARLLGDADPGHREQLAWLHIGFAHWVALLGGSVHDLVPVVDNLALLANRSESSDTLAQLARAILTVVDTAGPAYTQDLEAANPGRPWRLLHLNLGIIATRSRRPELMEQAFARLVQHLPQDAAQFFHQGMQQLERVEYPEAVRAVMTDYFQHWSGKPPLH